MRSDTPMSAPNFPKRRLGTLTYSSGNPTYQEESKIRDIKSPPMQSMAWRGEERFEKCFGTGQSN